MENKKEGILKKFWSKLKNFWNKLKNFWSILGTDVKYCEITDEGFQEEIDKRGMKALQDNSAEKCAENFLQPPAGRARRLDLSNALVNGEIVKKLIARRNEIKASANAKDRDDNVIE